MEFGQVLKFVAGKASKHTPEIFTGLGIIGFITTVAMTAKASPTVKEVHDIASCERANIRRAFDVVTADDEVALKNEIKEVTVSEVKELAPIILPIAAAGTISIGCFLMANKIHADRKTAIMAAYSLSEKTLSTYQKKVIEKLGEEAHKELLDETSKEVARNETPEQFDHETYLIPEGQVRVYDNVTGRYFFSTKERILEAESAINKRLLNETRVPLQEFYYELGLEEHFHLGDIMGWDISNMYMASGNTLTIWFTPMLDDDKNPCLALNYHVLVFDRTI